LIKTKAYIPILDEEYEDVMKLEKSAPKLGELKEDIDRQKKRLEAARIKAQQLSEPNTLQVLQRIRDENMLHEVESALAAAGADRDAADKCQNRLLDLKAAIDEIEDALDWPGLAVEARDVVEWAQGIVAEHGGDDDKRTFALLRPELESALDTRQVDEVRRKLSELRALGFKLITAQPGWWIGYFNYLKQQRELMSSRGRIDALIGQGDRAINGNDIEGLQAACRQLNDLLPEEEQEKAKGYGGTTHR
jgi:molecular chaperone DnaK